MVLLYLKQNSYDNDNRPDVAFEYFSGRALSISDFYDSMKDKQNY